ncbi:hypothetical protein KEM54_000938 [Ascosphaera aggregata]|nr:hypothetical protein KEM54_000938 [Ascosphaera aggregata]
MAVTQALQAKISELEEVIRRKDDAAELQRKGFSAATLHGSAEGRGSRLMPTAKHSSGFSQVAGSCRIEEMSSSASESSTSSIGTPGPTIFDDSSAPFSTTNAKDTCASMTPSTPRIFTPQSTGSDELNTFGAKSRPSLLSNAEPVLRVEGFSKRSTPLDSTNPMETSDLSLRFHGRLLELFHLTASFSQTYTNKPNSLTDGAADINCIMDLTMTKDRSIVNSLMSKQDTRCGLVERIINQFMTRHILFYEIVRGFNSTADSEIRQFLELLYSDTPGLVRSLFYTHLANQVLGLHSQPCFSSQFQMRQSVNANSLFSIISPLLQDSPSLAPRSHVQNMRSDFLSIIQTAHILGLDMISGAYEFNPFWPTVGERFDSAWMVNRDAGIIGHKVEAKKEGTVKLATSPGIWFADYTKGNGDRELEMIVSANVLLQKNEEWHI